MFFFISGGMGVSQVASAEFYEGAGQPGPGGAFVVFYKISGCEYGFQ